MPETSIASSLSWPSGTWRISHQTVICDIRSFARSIIFAMALVAAVPGNGHTQPIEIFPHADPDAGGPKPPGLGAVIVLPPELMHTPRTSDGPGPVSAQGRNDEDAIRHIGGPLTFSMGQVPGFASTPTISGRAIVGQRLSLGPVEVSWHGALHGDPPTLRFEMQWQRYSTNGIGTDIVGAHEETYRLEQADYGLQVRCQVALAFGDRRFYGDSQLTDVVR